MLGKTVEVAVGLNLGNLPVKSEPVKVQLGVAPPK